VPLVVVARTVVDGDFFAGFNEVFETEIGLPALSEVRVPQQLSVGAVVVSVVRHGSILWTDSVAVDVRHVGGGCDDVFGVVIEVVSLEVRRVGVELAVVVDLEVAW
jgi:hypothetical protein